MIRRRATPDGLPFRVYASWGPRMWRIWYQPLGEKRVDLYRQLAGAHSQQEAKRQALAKFAEISGEQPEGPMTFTRLWILYRDWQAGMSATDTRKKADSTLESEQWRIAWLLKVFGNSHPDTITPPDWTRYQDGRAAQGLGAGINHEIALASSILQYGVSRGYCTTNSARGVKRVRVVKQKTAVTLAQVDALMPVAMAKGPQSVRQVLAARTALLCLKRPIEVLRVRRDDILPEGLRFKQSKQRRGEPARWVIATWSDELRRTVEQAKAIKGRVDVTPLLFPNEDGRQYTSSGWGSTWGRLMKDAAQQIPGFQKFTLRDQRTAGVTAKQAAGHTDTQTLTQHTSPRMIQQVYDLNSTKKATPAA
jgi:hypothetical protein